MVAAVENFCPPFQLPCIMHNLIQEIAYYHIGMFLKVLLHVSRGSELRLVLIFTNLKHPQNVLGL